MGIPEELLPLLVRKLARERNLQAGVFRAVLSNPRLSRRKV